MLSHHEALTQIKAVKLVAMLDDDLALALEQGAAVDHFIGRHQPDRALRQVERTVAEQGGGLCGHRGDSVLGTS